jgi:hypothetical protein
VHGEFEAVVQLPRVARLDFVERALQLLERLFHLVGREVGREFFVQLVVTAKQVADRLHGFLHVFDDRLRGVERRFLRDVADRRPFGEVGVAVESRVDTAHDAQQRRFAAAVVADDADLRALVEGQRDALQNFLMVVLADEVPHGIDDLGHDPKR